MPDENKDFPLIQSENFGLVSGAVLSAAPIQTASVKLVNAGNPTNLISGGVYISPYTLMIDGQNYAAMCIDYNDESRIGATWTAYLTPIGSGDFTDTYHAGDANVAQEYEEEAYLFNQITQPGISNQQRIEIQHAGWSITDPSFTANAGAQNWVQLAASNYGSMDFTGYEIVSSVNMPHEQEFLIAVPEPRSWALLLTGFLLAGACAFYRRKRAA